jgi:DNA (cytosine-5)-methyltransferase 1
VIDWGIPGQRIGDRKKDLAPNTRARIQYGLKKHGNSDFVIYLDHSKAGHLTSDIKSPINTQTTSQVSAIVSPFMLKVDRSIKDYKVTDPNPTVVGGGLHHGIVGIPAMMTKGGYSGGASPISASEPTITTQHNYGVVAVPAMIDGLNRTGKARPISQPAGTALAGGNHHGLLGIPTQPFIVEHFGQSSVRDIKAPLGAVMTKDKYGILAPPMIITNKGQSMAMDITKPLSTQTQCINHGILSTESVNAFLSYYYGNAQVSGMQDPACTMTTKDRVALVLRPTEKIDIEDCTYRMLKPHEVQAAMAFGRDYIVLGNHRDQVKQLGNAVTPPAMEWLVQKCVESLV